MTEVIIDPPFDVEPLEVWKGFLEELQELAKENPDNDMIKDHIAIAEKVIAAKEQG
jgi:hypothetical protein